MSTKAAQADQAITAGSTSGLPCCRLCDERLQAPFLDLGMTPLANSYPAVSELDEPTVFYPLRVYRCEECHLVQLAEAVPPPDMFSEYAYFSSYSDSWLEHARRYTEMAAERFALNEESSVVEVASNDGYLLRHFKEQGVEVLGIEPARNVARAAEALGIPTRVQFFGKRSAHLLSQEGITADLVVANNVLGHVPDLIDFADGLRELLQPAGTITLEFPHLLRLMESNQFDTIYHEHLSYISLTSARRLFADRGLRVFDVEELPTHGGSLRLYVCHSADARPTSTEIERLLRIESEEILDPAAYGRFARRVANSKLELVSFLVEAHRDGARVAGYGAPAKACTLLNYCGIGSDLLAYTVDRSQYKQGRFIPGTGIPICSPDRIRTEPPDFLLILPWNLKHEVMEQMNDFRLSGGRFVVAIPEVEVLD